MNFTSISRSNLLLAFYKFLFHYIYANTYGKQLQIAWEQTVYRLISL